MQNTLHKKARQTDLMRELFYFLQQSFDPRLGFSHITSDSLDLESNSQKLYSPFFLSLIFSNLLKIDDFMESVPLSDLNANLALTLLRERSDFFSFNYWYRGSSISKTKPYPDDLDDTFAALNALILFDKDFFDGNVLGKITQILTFCEAHEGGPYRTWVVPENAKSHWKDVDPFVNAHIGLFLSRLDIELPELTKYIEQTIATDSFNSQYYPSQLPGALFLLEWYTGPFRKKLLADLHAKYESFSFLEKVVFGCITFNEKGEEYQKIKLSLRELILQKEFDEIITPYAFCLDPAQNGVKFFAGSTELTASFVLRFLSLFSDNDAKVLKTQTDDSIFLESVLSFSYSFFTDQEPCLRNAFSGMLTFLQDKERFDEIALLPHAFSHALTYSHKQKDIRALCAASLFGWISYTLFDDAMDGDIDSELRLPLAITCHRNMVRLFRETINNQRFDLLFENIMNRLDEANQWEILYARKKITGGDLSSFSHYIDSSQLAYKSYGHMLACVSQLFLAKEKNITTIHAFITFFHHYLIARQLNDDAHDVREDLEAGHVSYIVSRMLLDFETESCFINSAAVVDSLHKKYWRDTSLIAADEILDHVTKAQHVLEYARPVIADTLFFEQLLFSAKKGALEMKRERQKTFDFIKQF